MLCNKFSGLFHAALSIWRRESFQEEPTFAYSRVPAVDVHSCGFTVSNGWKFHNTVKDKWVVCMARSVEEKQAWLDAIVGARGRNSGMHNKHRLL